MDSLSSDKEAYDDALTHCREIVSEATIDMPLKPKAIHDNYIKANVNKQVPVKSESTAKGFCIRSGKQIALNHERPLSGDAYSVWSQYSDYDYPENYCHFTGEKSNGNTSVGMPILSKNWKKYLKVKD